MSRTAASTRGRSRRAGTAAAAIRAGGTGLDQEVERQDEDREEPEQPADDADDRAERLFRPLSRYRSPRRARSTACRQRQVLVSMPLRDQPLLRVACSNIAGAACPELAAPAR